MSFVNGIAATPRRWARALPVPVKRSLHALLDSVLGLSLIGRERYCPICEKPSNRFGPYGVNQRNDAQCLRCGSLERHRLLWLHMLTKTSLFDGTPKKVLHIAPEPAFEPRFEKQFGAGYITADLFSPLVKVQMDITQINFADNTFDFILCSHVLEHVQEDRRAMAEFHRTLKPDGFAILLVPIYSAKTIEDASIVDPAARLAAFHQEDHVRIYGPDYVDRLREAGFEVETTIATDSFSKEEIHLMALQHSGQIFHCTKG